MKCKPLVCFGNAYDCKEAIESFNELPCDKLRLDFIGYPQNFLKAQEFFLSHKEYTHFIYLAPDLVISKSEFLELKEIIDDNDYDVYGPVCNMDNAKYKDKMDCCIKLPSIEYESRNYRLLQEEVRQYLLNDGIKNLKVKFNGLTFCFIKREILMKYTFSTLPFKTNEKPIWEARGGWACDLAFAHYCDFNNIDMIVNLKIKLKHLRFWGKLQIGLKPPKMEFIKWK